MSKPRVFISSTYYDLKQTREDIATFIDGLGYESVRNEEGNIPYGNQDSLASYCYKEIQNVDILISIIGGRFGSQAQDSQWSISNEELRAALKSGKQVYIFIEKNVDAEYGTYLENKDREINFHYVDNIKIYNFIEEIRGLSSNNNIKSFESSAEIQHYLKEQLSGLFQSFLASQSRVREYNLAARLESTTKNLEKMVDSLTRITDGNQQGVHNFMRMAHPIVKRLSELLDLHFGFWLDNLEELKNLLGSIGWGEVYSEDSDVSKYQWTRHDRVLSIDKTLFDESGQLLDIKYADWSDSFVEEDSIIQDVSDFEFEPPF